MGRFDGQIAIVTGAGGGVGREHALLLAAEGAAVVVNDYGGDDLGTPGTSARADAVVKEITANGGVAIAEYSDVAVGAEAIVRRAIDAFGGLHVVINNAGIGGHGTLDTVSVGEFDRALAIHLGGTVGVCRAAWPIFTQQHYGRIVNTSSGAVFGLARTYPYIAAKAAVFGFTRAIAHDGRSMNIKSNAIMPVAYSRLMEGSPVAAFAQAKLPANMIAPFVGALASRDVPCTGETFTVGGGRAARVVLATVPGLLDATSIDTVLSRFDEALGSDDFYVPESGFDEIVYGCTHLGLDPTTVISS